MGGRATAPRGCVSNDFLPVIPAPVPPGGRTNVLPLAHLHLKAGWHPAPVHFFTLPLWYDRGGTYDEQQAAREQAAIFDRSYLGRFYVTGEGAEDVLGRVFATDPRSIPLRGVGRLVACRDDGTVLDLATGCRLEEGRWLVISGPRAQTLLREAVVAAVRPGEEIVVRDRLEESVLLAVHGPRAADALEAMLGPTLARAVPDGEAHEVLLGGYRALVMHHSEIGEDGWWFLVSPEVGEHLWENALTAGIVPAGLAAYDAMRLEAGGIEAPTETPSPAMPAHAGLSALVRRDARGFPGAEAIAAAGAPERSLAGIIIEGKGLAKRGSSVVARGERIGACVNATYSPALEAPIALAYLPPGLDRVEVEVDGEALPGRVVPLPFLRGPRGAATPS